MGRGINLGNVYDAYRGEVWNDPTFEVQRARVDLLQSAGFAHVRVPVTWGETFENDDRTNNAEKVVRYAVQRGLYVVLNTHHEHWLKAEYDSSETLDNAFANLWLNIARRFEDVGPKLVFEILNEPDGAMGDWQNNPSPGDPVAIQRTRRINQVGYDAVRHVSPQRVVLVMPNGMGNHIWARTIYPDRQALPGNGQDPWLGLSVHTYDPWEFCGETGRNNRFNDAWSMKTVIQEGGRDIIDWFYETGVPVHVGEYGVGRVNGTVHERDTDLVREYYRFQTHYFAIHGIPTTVWDDQGWFAISRGMDFVDGLVDHVLGHY